MAKTRLVLTFHKGDPLVRDFESEEAAKSALDELLASMQARGSATNPTMIAGSFVVTPADVRTVELVEASMGFA